MVLVNTKVSEMPYCVYRSLVTEVTKEHNAIIIGVRYSTT